jgi:hypothetical protein
LQVPTDASWQLYYNESGIIPADAAAVTTSRDGRYLFKFGGVKHPKPGKNLDTVHAFSVCQREWVVIPQVPLDPGVRHGNCALSRSWGAFIDRY